MESEEFLLLPAGQLVDIISSDELNVRSEEQVYNAVMSWLKYNVSERRQHLAQVNIAYEYNNWIECLLYAAVCNKTLHIPGFATC